MALNKKELEFFKNEMTWREFADDAGAKVLVRGIAEITQKDPTENTQETSAEDRAGHCGHWT